MISWFLKHFLYQWSFVGSKRYRCEALNKLGRLFYSVGTVGCRWESYWPEKCHDQIAIKEGGSSFQNELKGDQPYPHHTEGVTIQIGLVLSEFQTLVRMVTASQHYFCWVTPRALSRRQYWRVTDRLLVHSGKFGVNFLARKGSQNPSW